MPPRRAEDHESLLITMTAYYCTECACDRLKISQKEIFSKWHDDLVSIPSLECGKIIVTYIVYPTCPFPLSFKRTMSFSPFQNLFWLHQSFDLETFFFSTNPYVEWRNSLIKPLSPEFLSFTKSKQLVFWMKRKKS